MQSHVIQYAADMFGQGRHPSGGPTTLHRFQIWSQPTSARECVCKAKPWLPAASVAASIASANSRTSPAATPTACSALCKLQLRGGQLPHDSVPPPALAYARPPSGILPEPMQGLTQSAAALVLAGAATVSPASLITSGALA